MKLNLETKYNIYDKVRYKKIDTFAIFECGECKEEIKEDKIVAINIDVTQDGNLYVRYIMNNEDEVCYDCIIGELIEGILYERI